MASKDADATQAKDSSHSKDANQGASRKKPQDVVDFIIADHEDVKKQYSIIKGAGAGQQDQKALEDPQTTFDAMMWNISKHSVAEELVLYPIYKEFGEKGEIMLKEATDEHNEVKQALMELDGKSIKDDDTRAKVDEMMTGLLEHMEKEEKGDLVEVRKNIPQEQLVKLGVEFEKTKKLIPESQTPGEKPHDAEFKSAVKLASASMDEVRGALQKFSGGEEGKQEEMHYNLRHRDARGHVTPEKEDGESKSRTRGGSDERKSRSPGKKGTPEKSHQESGHAASGKTNRAEADSTKGGADAAGAGETDGKSHGKRHNSSSDGGADSGSHKKVALSGSGDKNAESK